MPDDRPPDELPAHPETPLTPEQQLALFLKQLLADEILPTIQQQQEQLLDARLTEIRTWVSSQITPLRPPDPQGLAKQVGDLLGAQLQRDLDPVSQMVQHLRDRLGVLEGRADPQAPQAAHLAQIETPEETSKPAGVMGWAALLETLVDIVVQKGLPAVTQVMQMRQTNKLFSMDPAAIETFRKANPAYSLILANQLAPDQNMMGLLNQLPFITANAIGVGMKARVMAPQLIGGATWPGTPGLGLPGSSPNLPGGPSPGPAGPRTGASMQNRRPRPSRNGKTGFLSSRITPTNGVAPPAPKRLIELLR